MTHEGRNLCPCWRWRPLQQGVAGLPSWPEGATVAADVTDAEAAAECGIVVEAMRPRLLLVWLLLVLDLPRLLEA
jgi:hypothetical protein